MSVTLRTPLSNAERQRNFRQRQGEAGRKQDAERKAKERAAKKAADERNLPLQLKKWNKILVKENLSVNRGLFLKNADQGKGVCWQLFDHIDNSRSLSLEYAEARQRSACEGVFDDPYLAEVYIEETCQNKTRQAYQYEVRPQGHGIDADEWDEEEGCGKVSLRTELVGPGFDDDPDDYDPIAGWLDFKPTFASEAPSEEGLAVREFDASVTDGSLETDI